MKLQANKCPSCGSADTKEIATGKYKCGYCDSEYVVGLSVKDSEYIIKHTEKALWEQTVQQIEKILTNLHEEVHKEYINDKEVIHWCRELRKLIPEHFMAEFYEKAVGNDKRALSEYISSIDVEAHYADIEEVLRFSIKLISSETLLAINNLIIRAYEKSDVLLQSKWNDILLNEQVKVDELIYDVTKPRDVFIAYKSEDMKDVEKLVDVLENEEGLECFVAARNLQHGRISDYDKKLEQAMDSCKAIVFVSSKMSRRMGDARTKELPYIQQKDFAAAPPEYKVRNAYTKIPKQYKKPRVEYVIENYVNVASEGFTKTFFDGYERVLKPNARAVAESLFVQFDTPIEIEEKAVEPVEEKPSEKTDVKYCIACGKENSFDAKFCSACGKTEFVETQEKYLELQLRKKLEAEYAAKLEAELKEREEAAKKAEELEQQTRNAEEKRWAELEALRKKAEELEQQKREAEQRAARLEAEQAAKRQAELEQERNRSRRNLALAIKAVMEKKRRIETATNDFQVKDNVLIRYKGKGGDVVIPKGVTSIGYRAFQGCGGVKSVKIPNGVTSIDGEAFRDCRSLWRVEIPDSVTSIGNQAFCDCISLTDIALPSGITSIGYYVLADCSSLTNIKIPNGVTSIGEGAFSGCSSLINIKIPNGVTSIGNRAFVDCSILTSIKIPNSVKSIGEYTFSCCGSLTSIEIPNGVTSIGKYAFNCCGSLVGMNLPYSVKNIGDSAFFGCSSLERVEMQNNVTSIGKFAFGDCTSLTRIYFDGSEEQWHKVKKDKTWNVGINANCKVYFSSGSSININEANDKSVKKKATQPIGTIPNNYYGSAFDIKDTVLIKYNGNGSDIVIPNGVTGIGNNAFCNCSSLTRVRIHDRVTSIGACAFSGCIKLTRINYDGTLEQWNKVVKGQNWNFGINENCKVYFNSGSSVDINKANDNFVKKKATQPLDEYPTLRNYDKKEFGINGIELKKYKGKSASVRIPQGVVKIGDNAFSGRSSLTSIEIPDSVTSIAQYAFYGCNSLERVTMQNNVTSIGWNAFSGCSSLTSIEIPNSVTDIGSGVFWMCRNLKSIKLPNGITNIGGWLFYRCDELKSILIPGKVTSIGESAFSGCRRLERVEIPRSVTVIERNAFEDCFELTSIKYSGTIRQWKEIKKRMWWKHKINKYCKVYCTDGTINV